jgi:hypothetical protein
VSKATYLREVEPVLSTRGTFRQPTLRGHLSTRDRCASWELFAACNATFCYLVLNARWRSQYKIPGPSPRTSN